MLIIRYEISGEKNTCVAPVPFHYGTLILLKRVRTGQSRHIPSEASGGPSSVDSLNHRLLHH